MFFATPNTPERLGGFIYYLSYKWLKNRQIFLHRFPDHLYIHSKVIVYELVPNSRYLSPRHLWRTIPYRLWYFLCRFPNDLQRSNYREHCLIVGGKPLEVPPLRELFGLFDCVMDVLEVVHNLPSARLHTETTPLKIRLPIAGLRTSFITKSTLTPSKSLR
jgi:hypothetical protein